MSSVEARRRVARHALDVHRHAFEFASSDREVRAHPRIDLPLLGSVHFSGTVRLLERLLDVCHRPPEVAGQDRRHLVQRQRLGPRELVGMAEVRLGMAKDRHRNVGDVVLGNGRHLAATRGPSDGPVRAGHHREEVEVETVTEEREREPRRAKALLRSPVVRASVKVASGAAAKNDVYTTCFTPADAAASMNVKCCRSRSGASEADTNSRTSTPSSAWTRVSRSPYEATLTSD